MSGLSPLSGVDKGGDTRSRKGAVDGASPQQDATIAARLAELKAGTTNTVRRDQATQYDSCEGVLPHQGYIAARSLKPPGVLATAECQNRQEKKSTHEPSGHRPYPRAPEPQLSERVRLEGLSKAPHSQLVDRL